MSMSHELTISATGDVELPAEVLARWRTAKVLLVDLGDHVVMRPMPTDPAEALRGKYKDRGPDTEEARGTDRAEEAMTIIRKMQAYVRTDGRKFTREEMNER